MTKKLRFALLLAALVTPWAVGAQSLADYSASVSTTTYTSIASTGTQLTGVANDSGTQTISMPFDFPFGEEIIAAGTGIVVRADGHIGLNGTTSRDYADVNYTSGEYYSIIPFHAHDGYMRSGSAAYWAVEEDEDGNQALVIEWVNVGSYQSSSTQWNYQLRLYPNGNVSVTFGQMTGTSSYANFFMQAQPPATEHVLLTGSWDNPVAAAPATLTYLTGNPENGTVITYIPPVITCPKPTSLTASDITTTSATISWTPADGVSTYLYEYDTENFIPGSGEHNHASTSETSVDLDLEASQQYYVYVRSDCGEDSSRWMPLTFRTPCETLTHDDLPLSANYEDISTSEIYNAVCWQTHNFYTSSPNYPIGSASYAHNSTKSLYFYPGYSHQPQFLVSPAIEDLNGLMLNFWYLANTNIRLTVGYMTDANDTTSFTALASYTGTGIYSTPWAEVEYIFGDVPDEAQFVALRVGVTTSYGYPAYIDDLSIMVAPECSRPASLAVSAITENTATLTITDPMAVGSYGIVLSHNGINDTIETEELVNELTDLDASSAYTVAVYAICGDGSVTASTSTAFRTSCAAASLPWTEGFEAFNTNDTDPGCWNAIQPYTSGATVYPYVSATNHTGSHAFYSYYTCRFVTTSFAAAPNQLDVNFWAYTTNTGLQVGIMTDPSDESTWRPLFNVPNSNSSWAEYDFTSDTVTLQGSIVYLAFRYSGTGSMYIDDITVNLSSGCSRPNAVNLGELLANSVELNWDGNDEDSYTVEYTAAGGTAQSVTVTGTSTTLTELEANTTYTISVMKNCGDDLTSSARTISVLTPCLPIATADLPYDEGFESMTPNSLDPCWKRMYWNAYTISNTSYPYVSASQAHSGSNSLYLYNYYYYDYYDYMTAPTASGSPMPLTTPNYSYDEYFSMALMPLFEQPLQGLTCTFWVRGAYSSGSRLAVGVASDNADTSTFTRLMTITPNTTWTEYELDLASYTGNGNRIAFLAIPNSYSDNDVYIDDIHIEAIGGCTRPATVTVSDIDATSATVNWTDLSDETGTYSVALYSGSTQVDSVTVSDALTTTFSGLSASTAYTVSVRRLCDGELTNARTASFRTSCGVISDLPWSENFDTYGDLFTTYPSALSDDLPCWDFIGVTSSAHLSLTNNSYRYGQSGFSLLIYPGTANAANVLVLPSFSTEISQLQLSFQTRPEGTGSNPGSMDIGYLTNASDASSFVAVSHHDYTDFSDAYTLLTATFADAPAGSRMAIRHNTVAYNYYWFFDEFTVDVAGDIPTPPTPDPCDAPTDVTAGVTTGNVTIYWTATGDYEVALANGSSWSEPAAADIQQVSASPYTWNGLVPNTTYTVGVRQVCDDNNHSDWVTRTVTTSQVGIGDVEFGDSNFELYPNPASGSVSIAGFEGQVAIVDLNGREVMTAQVGDTRASIDISSLPAGAYFVRLTSEDSTAVRKLIVK